jgi:hypothetical protein
MAHFDRFDICEAYKCLENDWHSGGVLWERPSNLRRGEAHGFRAESTDVQLERMHFRARSPLSTANLSDNAREIYALACERMRLGDGGYHPCAVPDCFETAIGWGAPVCLDCQEHGCGELGRCDCPGDWEE